MDFTEIAAASRESNSRQGDEKGQDVELVDTDQNADFEEEDAPKKDSAAQTEKPAGEAGEQGKDKDKKIEAAPEKKAEEKPQDKDSRVADLETKLAAAEKRTRDNQAAYHAAHQEELRLKKENELLKTGKPVIPGEESEWFDPDNKDKKPEEKKEVQPDPEIAVIKKEIADLKQQDWQKTWDAAEKPVREKFEDYGKIVDEFLAPEFETNSELQKRFQEKGGTPEAAYELGKELYFLRNPDKYREHVLAEEAKKTKKEDEDTPDKKPTLNDLSVNSKKPGGSDVVKPRVTHGQALIDRVFPS